jgi:hypothetical protein
LIPLTLNWLGIGVHDVPAASSFDGGMLGFAFEDGERDRQFAWSWGLMLLELCKLRVWVKLISPGANYRDGRFCH